MKRLLEWVKGKLAKEPVRATCNNCQYWRTGKWCSNSKSPNMWASMPHVGSCEGFTERGKKAPWWMRAAVMVVERVDQEMGRWAPRNGKRATTKYTKSTKGKKEKEDL